jgi:two-component system phosphate regulon sensor histidine kinase PhoR
MSGSEVDLQSSLWRSLGVRLLGVAAAAFLAFAVHGLTLALATAVVVMAMLYVLQTRKLAALSEWVAEPKDERFPSAGGLWGLVFLSLARHLRGINRQRQDAANELLFFKDAVEALPDGVVLLDRHHQVLWCNRRAEQHLGLLRERDTGRVVSQLFRQPGFNTYLNEAAPEKPFVFPLAGVDERSPRTFALEKIDYGVLNKLLVSYDITDRQRAEAMRRDFVANVSHELRTPLTVVSGFLEHFSGDAEIPAAQRQRFVTLMHDQSQRMLRLVDDLLTLSRLDSDETPPNEETIDLPTLLEEIRSEGEGLSDGRHRIELVAPQGGQLRGNRHELRSAFGNLVSNASRYTPDGGNVRIAWERRALEYVFSVSDSGVGIPAEHIPRLTERFYRVDKGRSRDSGGTGLGLAIVKHVLLRHQARLEIASQPGAGSTFSAIFPGWRCEAVPSRPTTAPDA